MSSNIHGISCTANNYLKQAWNDIKNEYEKNQTYSITLFENTLVCFMRLYNELRRKVNEEDIPCLECESLEKQLYEMQNDNDLSSFLKTLHAKDTKIYSGVSGGFTYTIKYSQERELVIISLPYRSSETIADFKGYCWLNFIKFIESLCDDVFSEYCLDDENMSIQPEWINTPGISDLDSGIDLSGISFIQSEINKTYGLKYAPVDGDGYCLLRAILVLKEHEYSWALGSHKTQKQVYEEFIKIVDKQTIEALVDTAFNDLREDVKTLFGVELQSDNKIQGEGGFLSWSFLSFKKEFIDSCLNDKKCILHLPEFIFNDNKAHLVLDSAPEKRINEVKNFLTALSDSICSLFIVNSNVASISLGNESFSTDEDLEYGYLINTGNHYDVYLPPELFAQAYKLRN
ncbi:YccE family protein, partial [Escherichia coli]|nr:YccE family protein [Escherichia coli]EFC7341334.1 YccE family protein [Escherichia coli]EFG9242608.1 YccE family protein [Escherichia coli]EFH2849601.1 YccE family protein [Escherichia coli]EFH3189508.1 YccE family protein [Escherichia coli]